MRDFINHLHKVGYPPFSESDIKDTGGESILIRAKDDRNGKKTLYFSFHKNFGHWYSCKTAEYGFWFNKAAKNATPEERAALKLEREAWIAKREDELKETYDRVSEQCRREYATLKTADSSHKYIQDKWITLPPKVRLNGENLIIPAVNADGVIRTLQSISPDGEKRFTYQGNKKGCYFPIGLRKSDVPKVIYFCEGFATGCTIYEATEKPTIVCFDAGNLSDVVKHFRSRYESTQFILAADNDQWTLKSPRDKKIANVVQSEVDGDDPRWEVWRRDGHTYNTGLDKAGQCGAKYGAKVIAPDIPHDDKLKRTDYNDMGVEYTKDRLLGVVSPLSYSEIVPSEVELLAPPSQTAPSDGDIISDRFYTPTDESVMFAFAPATELSSKRSDGNPSWFTDMIWDKEPSPSLPSVYAIKDLHNGKSLSNLIVFTRGNFSGLFVLDEFSDEIVVRVRPPWLSDGVKFYVHALTDSDIINYTAFIEYYGFSIGKDRVRDAIVAISEKDKIHPVRQYFDAIRWDGIPRLDTWLIDYAGATDQPEEYVKTIGSKWLIAAAARIYDAGCKFDHMLVLEGKSDIGKSAILREMATFGTDVEKAYFLDSVSMLDFDKEFSAMKWQGTLIIEFAELDGMNKTSINTVKAWITRQEETYLRKFSNERVRRPRQFVLSGTTNEDTWLIDSTGNKRFWPVRCTSIDNKSLKLVKNQIWAEAVARYKAGEQWWLEDTNPVYDLAKEEQSYRLTADSWADVLLPKIKTKDFITTTDVYEYLGIPITHRNKDTEVRIRGIMRGFGFEHKKHYAATKSHLRVWVKG